ncbi:hypothetical protein PUN28_014890 [Cardiocondyla obscurior]|uniref:Uncharacterized protein n=1 Tax=Cardiocondyla obscurior TaxID=286306 RepID=A0AAW2F193_9HYME
MKRKMNYKLGSIREKSRNRKKRSSAASANAARDKRVMSMTKKRMKQATRNTAEGRNRGGRSSHWWRKKTEGDMKAGVELGEAERDLIAAREQRETNERREKRGERERENDQRIQKKRRREREKEKKERTKTKR